MLIYCNKRQLLGEGVRMQTDMCYKCLFDALKSGSMEELIHTAYDIMGHPLIFTNASYVKLTEVYPPDRQDDEKWDAYIGRSEVNVETIVDIFEHDYIDIMKQTGNAVLMDAGYFADSPRLTAPVLSGGQLIGYVSMLCQNEIPGPDSCQNLRLIAETLALHMREFYTARQDQLNLWSIFAEKLISGEIQSEDQLRKWFLLTNIHPQPRYIMLAMSSKNRTQTRLARYLCSKIQTLSLPVLLYQTETTVCGLLYGLKDAKARDRILQQLEKLLQEFDFACGVSRSFDSLEKIPQYRRQSEIALRIGEFYHFADYLHRYRQLTLTAIADSVTASLGYENAIHPAAELLQWSDEINNTEYLRTLKTYVLSGFNSAESCRQLHIHRNTLNYRLARIMEMAGIDLKQPEVRIHLDITFVMMKTNEDVRGH